jgi:transcriptional regulator with XRE-family HTH domain
MTYPSESPAGARRRVRLAVRHAREERHLTQSEVAEAMDWSLSKVMRIEAGEVTIAPNDLRPLLSYLGIKDKRTVDSLVAAAKQSKQRRQQWWDSSEFRDGLTPALRQVAQLEPEATALRYFFPLNIPGRLQTPEYAEAVINHFRGQVPDRILRARLAVRMQRRDVFLAVESPPVTYAVLDESVLLRPIGGSAVMREQLNELVRLTEERNLRLRIKSFDETPIPLMGQFEIIYLEGESDEDAIMYRESDLLDEVVDDPNTIRRHRSIFERVWYASLEEGPSIKRIRQRADELSQQ